MPVCLKFSLGTLIVVLSFM